MHRYILIILLFGLTACAVADPRAEVRCREIAFSQSAEYRDLESFTSFLDADARFLGSHVLRGPDDITAAWQVFFQDNGPRIKWRPQFVEVLEDGKLAITRGPFRMVSSDQEGNAAVSWGTFNSVWRLHSDGQWRVVFDAGSAAEKAPDENTEILLDADDDC